ERRTTNTKVPRVYYFYNKDLRASTTSVIAESGAAVKAYKYDEFGNTESFGNLDNEVAYTGGIYDKSNQLYYLNARYYNPEDGRFITQDSYRGTNEDMGTWHMYAYCKNNPVNYVDPSGHIFFNFVSLFGISISKYTHYNRNIYNTGVPKYEKNLTSGYKLYSYANSLCHQFHVRDGKYNRKYVKGHKEGVYWGGGKSVGKKVKNAEDRGTYNFALGTGVWHAMLDVVPYMIWGNSYDDSTNIATRIWKSSSELRKSTYKKVKKALKKKGYKW
ncbi:MAG: RHS repeat-associated core domain-containing protein, partial [Anaerovoracaceae bacterium]